ncbi:uncharacterized protein LOC141612827 [Silene latifolia]|uniref:uncharacterized protein LOC141612827 n=1 Tax=Silene latifolia TaxID=37657 RepID=UPI003D7896C0
MDAAINDGDDDMYTRANDKVQEFAKVVAEFILGVKNGNGNWIYEPDLVGEIFYDSFYNLYNPQCTDDGIVRENLMEEVLMGINKTVHGDDCDVLSRPFTAQEVRTTVFQMGALKSPGPDGIPAIFYQKCWYFIKKDVTTAVLSVLNSGMVLKEHNRTFITLIPKCDNPEKVGDYRPISLCNVFMRIVSKCVTNRMAKVMGYLVGDFQNAFIPGRQISDNIILANEALHKINSHKKGKSGDDAVFFLHDRKNSTRNLRAILKKYCKVSGQARCGMRNLRVKGTKGLGKYLGLPTDLQGSKRELFKGLIDIVMKRISSWNGIFLTPAGSVQAILAKPICRTQTTDEVYWLHNSDGQYSVKSGYGILFQDFMVRRGSVKDKERLSRAGLWACSELGIRTNQASFLQIDTWIIDWMVYLEKSECREEQQIRFLATLWCIWSTLNQILFQGVEFHPMMFFNHWSQIVSTGIQAIEELKKGACALEGNLTPLARDNANWVRNSNPICVVGRIGDCGYVRVMVDAGWKGFNKAGVGWIAMSENGQIFHSMERKIKVESALQAEGLGVLLVLLWARERGLRHLEISSDCLSLILQLAGMERRHLLLKAILEEICDCFTSFHCLAFSYVPRRFNHDAHSLACKAMDS